MSFVYNNEVIDLLLKKSLGSAYTSSALVPGQENQILPKILNQQLFASPITNKTASNFTWSSSTNVTGGGTVKSLSNVAGETEPTSFTYIKKYENIPMTVVAGTNYRAWKPSNADMISKLENTIIGKASFPFTLTTNITNYTTIYNTNSSFKPVISNGVLLFLGNIAPDSSSTISFSEVYIYEGEFGAKSELELNELTNVNVPTPSNGELLQWDAANSQWISGPAAASAIADANIEALNNVNVSHATTNQDDSLIYDKANNQWVAGTPVTTLAGLTDTELGSTTTVTSYTWTELIAKANGPDNWRVRYNHAGVIYGDKLVIFGGNIGNPYLNDVWETDLSSSTPTWTQLIASGASGSPFGRYSHDAVLYGTKMIMFGGDAWPNGNRNDVWQLELSSSPPVWTELISHGTAGSPPGRYSNSLILYGTKLIIFGGQSTEALKDVWAFELTTNTWTQLHDGTGTAPGARYEHTAVLYNTKMIIFGGDGAPNDVWEFNLVNNTWLQIHDGTGTAPVARYDAMSIVYGTQMIIFGDGNNYLNDVWAFELTTNTWTLLISHGTAGSPPGRYEHSVHLYGTKMIVCGGEGSAHQKMDVWQLQLPYNVNIGPTDGQSVLYNATSSKWESANLTTDNITDINLTSVANGQALVYDSATSKFVNGLPNLNINNVSDVNITSPADKNVLIYDTATQKWINGLPVLNVNDINDVNTSGLIDGQVLVYDNNTQKWVPGSAAASSVTGVYLRDLQDVDMTNLSQVVPVWTQTHKLVATTGENSENLGKSVSTIGTWTAVGAPNKAGTFPKEKVGRVFLFKAGQETQIINSPTDQTNDYYGESLFLTATFLVVGSPGYDDTGTQVLNTGALLIYNYNSGTELYATTANQTLIGTANSYLGYSIDTNGTWMISGAPENITGTSNALKGKAYIYKLDTTWSQKKILTAEDGANGDKFGTAVAINNDYAFVGCETKNSYAGGVYIYKRTSDTVWNALHIVRSKTLATGDYFGQSIAIGGDFLMVGCPKGEYGGTADSTKAGEVFVYKKQSDGNWGDLSGNLTPTLTQLGSDIDGEAAGDQFGYSVSMNQDGTIVAIGAHEHNNSSGHVRVYQYSNNAWTQLGSDIDGEADDDNSGASISLSSDGTILAIGAPFNGGTGSNAGHVRVYQYTNNAWTQLGSDIDAEAAGDEYGNSVSLSSNGSIVAIGSTVHDGNKGHVRVYQYSNNAWTQLGSDIDGETGGGEGIGDSSGIVSLSSDGSILAIGAPNHDGGKGHVRVYQYSNNAWTQLGSNIDGEAAGDNFGYRVSLSSDGSILAIGAPNHDGGKGHVRVYQYSNNAWTQLGSDIDGEAAGDNSGASISLSNNGTILAIGAPYNDGTGNSAGLVRVYQYSNNSWTQLGSDIDGEAAGDNSGKSISLSSDGTILAIGAPNNNSEKGHVRVYQLPITDETAGYYENSKLTASDSAVNDHFGCSVDITTQFGVIGARTQGSSYTRAGAAYMISNTGEGYWDHSKKITASDLAIGDEFGISVSISGRYAAIGAWKEEDTGEVDQGSAYLFNLADTQQVQNTLIYNSDTGRWSIGTITSSGSGSGSGLDSIIGTQAMIDANTPNGAQLFWDATNQTWSTDTSTFLPTGDPDQSSPTSGPTWTTSWNGGDNQLTFNSHLVPTADNTYDLGSPSLKIRDIYVSDASIWIGDTHKIAIEGGAMKFRKRDVSTVPSTITAAGGTSAAALALAGKTNLSDMKLKDWEAYGKTLNIGGLGVGNAKIKDIFTTNDNDYETSDNVNDKAPKNNPVFTGTVTLGQAPTGDLHAATKKYVDDTAGSIDTSTLAPKANPVFTGKPEVGGLKIDGSYDNGDYYAIYNKNTPNGSSTAYNFLGSNDGNTYVNCASGQAINFRENNVNKMRLINGNLGIGTTSPSYKLDVNGTAVIRDQFDIYKTGGSKVTHFNWGSNGDIYLRSSETAGKIILQDDGGNVGIGTTSPSQKLEVNGTVKATAFQGDGSALTGILTANSPTFTGTPTAPTAAAGTNDNQIATTAFVSSSFAPKANPSFTGNIDVAGSGSFRGNSAINNSTVAGVHLGKYTHPNGTDNYGNIQIVSNNDNGGWIDWIKTSGDTDYRGRIRYGTGDQYEGMRFYTEPYSTDTNEKMIITTGGNVGIGTSSPDAKLVVKNSTNLLSGTLTSESDYALVAYGDKNNAVLAVSHPNRSQYITLSHNGIYKRGITSAYFEVMNTNSNELRLGTNNTTQMTIDGNGNVGIGTTSPKEKLHVIGSLMIAGTEAGNETGEEGIKIIPHYYTATSTAGNAGGRIFFKEDSTDNYGFSIGFNGGADNDILNWRGNNFAINRHDNNSTGSTVFSVKRETGNVILAEDGGNVGIGTTSPSQKLEVNGTVKATAFQGDGSALTGVAKQSDIDTAINGLIDSAPGTLNTLNELAASIGDATNFAGTVSNFADVDTVTTAPTDGQALVWDNTNSKWVPGSVAAASGGSSGGGFNWTAQDGTKNISDINLYTGYTITDSEDYANHNAYKAFDDSYKNTYEGYSSWASQNGRWNTTTGAYTHTGSTLTNIGTLSGAWLQIDFGRQAKVYHVVLTQGDTRSPRIYYIAGSNDNTNWTVVVSKTNTDVATNSGTLSAADDTLLQSEWNYQPTLLGSGGGFLSQLNTLSSPATYRYFRLIVTHTYSCTDVHGQMQMHLSGLKYYGAFPEQVDKVAVVSGTNMSFVNYKDNISNISLVKDQFYELSMLQLSITPTAVDSVIKLEYNLHVYIDTSGPWDVAYIVTRTVNGVETTFSKDPTNTDLYSGFMGEDMQQGSLSFQYNDEPNTTQEVIYKIKFTATGGNKTMFINRTHATEETEIYRETGVSSASAIEYPKPQQSLTTVTNATQVEGQVLETLEGKCDGRSVTVSSGTYTFPTAVHQTWSNTQHTMKDVDASIINYKPPVGTKQVIYEFQFVWQGLTSGYADCAYDFYIDGNTIGVTDHWNAGHYESKYHTLKLIVDIGETDDYTNNKLANWNSLKQIKIQMMERHSADRGFILHKNTMANPVYYSNQWFDVNTVYHPTIKITAIGTAQYDVVQRVVNYKDGQVLETIAGVCDGRSITSSSGTYTLENITQGTLMTYDTATFVDFPGSKISYKPPVGTKQVIYKFHFTIGRNALQSLFGYKLYIDNTEVTSSNRTHGTNDDYGRFITIQYTIDIGTDDFNNLKLLSWDTTKELKVKVAQGNSSSSYDFWLNKNYYELDDGVTNDQGSSDASTHVVKPQLEIQAIGRALAPVGNFKIQDVDTITTAPTNGQALVWNATNLKWEPGNVASSGGSGPTNVMGQSFFEILTQQPHKFQADGAYTSSTSELTINWKYDSILLFHDSTVVAKLCFGANAQAKSLPFISQIKIQLRSPDTGNNWTDYQTLTVSSSQDYNTTASLKTLTLPKFTGTPSGGIQTTLSKAGESNKFDIRVYGINNAENYPNEDTRALEYLQVFYLVPNPPSVPIWSSEVAIGSDASISFYYYCDETENIDPNNSGDQSDAFITSAITKYVEIETLAYNNPVLTTEYTDTESVSNKNENETFQITLAGLRAGTKYKYKVQAKNNLADNYSDFSAFRDHSAFTRTPGDNGIGTSVNFGINNSSRTSIRGYIDGTSTVSGSQIYINTAASQKVTPSTTSTQTIQITDPYSSTQHTTNTGYGNYVNGSTGLVTLKVTVDGTLKQTVSYGGFNTTPTDDSGSYTNFIDTIAQSDIYGTTNATKGFRLKGTFALNELSNTHITNTIGAAQKTAHTLKYEYDRHADVGGSDASTTHNIYIDSLSGNPGITYTTSLVTVTSVKYTMGIASVDDMTINIVRTYTNCNSVHGFIKGDGNVGYISAVSKTTYGAQYLTKSANDIDVSTPGSYTHSKSNTGINYTQAFTNGINDSLSETSKAYNLNGTTTGTAQSLKRGSSTSNATLNHFHDHNSYANDTTATSKLTLSNLYEITAATISNFGSNMGAIATQAYTSHSTVPQAWTLLYINGGFRTNANFTYPNTSNINYDSVSVNTYSHGTTAYSTAGASDTNGYKWYCQKFSMSANKSSHNVGGAITDYLNVYGIGGLSSSTMSKIKDAANLDAIGFVQQTVGGSSRIGNLGRAFKSTAVWYAQSGAVSWATQDTSATKANYGAVYEESSTKWGPILDTINGNDDIYIFIGLKNTVSLS